MPLDARRIIHPPYRFVASGHYLAFSRVKSGCIYVRWRYHAEQFVSHDHQTKEKIRWRHTYRGSSTRC